MIRLMTATILVSIAMTDMAGAASSIQAFVGRWTGHVIDAPDASIPAGVISIEISESDDGFELSWNDLAQNDQGVPTASPLEARFVGTDRAGVFEYSPKAGSFLDRMFASPTTSNPLKGEALLWARIDTDTLAVYNLTIDEVGGFDLGHYTWTRTDNGLAFHYSERTHELGEQSIVEGRLVPAGG